MNSKITFETDIPVPKTTFTWDEMRQNDGLYEVDPTEKGWVHWAIFVSSGHGEVCVSAIDGHCVLAHARKESWGHLRFVKSDGRLIISN